MNHEPTTNNGCPHHSIDPIRSSKSTKYCVCKVIPAIIYRMIFLLENNIIQSNIVEKFKSMQTIDSDNDK